MADMYSDGVGGEIAGRMLEDIAQDREYYVLATKAYFPTGDGPNDRGLSRKHVMGGGRCLARKTLNGLHRSVLHPSVGS
jgi:aryl-alcohol dehydrogenase-like predicted oxidoreductase